MAKFASPLVIVKWFFEDVCKLELLLEMKVHPTFNVLLLKPYKEDSLRLECEQMLHHVVELVGEYIE